MVQRVLGLPRGVDDSKLCHLLIVDENLLSNNFGPCELQIIVVIGNLKSMNKKYKN